LSTFDYNSTAITVQAAIGGQLLRLAEFHGYQAAEVSSILQQLEIVPGTELDQWVIEKAIHDQKAIMLLFCPENIQTPVNEFMIFAFKNMVK
jgi:hypothetical protein